MYRATSPVPVRLSQRIDANIVSSVGSRHGSHYYIGVDEDHLERSLRRESKRALRAFVTSSAASVPGPEPESYTSVPFFMYRPRGFLSGSITTLSPSVRMLSLVPGTRCSESRIFLGTTIR